jgi:hypothetical protein
MVGIRAVNHSFDKEDFSTRFKHFGKRDDDETKSVMGSKWRDVDQSYKASIDASEKTLKLEILKYKTKFEES